ncbi:MAG TPA: tetratricopeptide repeat protein, partial [Chloroflexota bacterium]|nr:tetratricopeptide repeat protein [Chloroflexota bacterium]
AVCVARAQLLEAVATVVSGRPEEGMRLCIEVLETPIVRRRKLLLAEAYRSLSFAEGVRGLGKPALEHLENALELYGQVGSTWDIALVLNNLGTAHAQLGQPEHALWAHTRALALQREFGNLSGVARSLNNLALLHLYRGALNETEGLFQEALELARQTSNPRSEAAALVNLADVRRAQQRWSCALESYRAAREAAQAADDPRWRAYALIGEDATLLHSGKLVDAERFGRQGLEAASSAGLLEVAGHARAILAGIALAADRRREAASLLEGARRVASDTESQELRVRAYLWSGYASYKQKRWGEAHACVQIAAEAAEALGGPGSFVLEGPALVPLLRFAAERGVAAELLARALDSLDVDAALRVREATAPPPPATVVALPTVELRLLGGFSAGIGGTPLSADTAAGNRVRELLAYLAVHPSGCRREEIGTDLWPDAAPGQDVTLTHTTLHRLRQATFPELVVGGATGVYQINPDVHIEVDILHFERLLHEADRAGVSDEVSQAHLEAAIHLYRGRFFPECYSDWATTIRARLERRYVASLARLIDTHWSKGEYRTCLDLCERLLTAEMNEDAVHCRILECYERLDEPLAGLLHYKRHLRDRNEDGNGAAGATLSTSRLGSLAKRLEARLQAMSTS